LKKTARPDGEEMVDEAKTKRVSNATMMSGSLWWNQNRLGVGPTENESNWRSDIHLGSYFPERPLASWVAVHWGARRLIN